MSQEIKFTEYKLEDCECNLRTLYSLWSFVPICWNKTISISKGMSASKVRDSLSMTNEISKSMQNLLENSIKFFEKAGIAFRDSDVSAAQNIDSLINR